MSYRTPILVLVLFSAAPAACAQPVTRLAPDAFPSAASPVRNMLYELGCSIPQDIAALESRQRVNVVRGNFIHPKRPDFAALCSISGVSRILVLNSKTGEVLASLGEVPDSDIMQSWTNGEIVFSRRISRAQKGRVARAAKEGSLPHPERWRHGIEDAFVGKASQIRYLTGGAWHSALSAD